MLWVFCGSLLPVRLALPRVCLEHVDNQHFLSSLPATVPDGGDGHGQQCVKQSGRFYDVKGPLIEVPKMVGLDPGRELGLGAPSGKG